MHPGTPLADFTIGTTPKAVEFIFRDSKGELNRIHQEITQAEIPLIYETTLAITEHPTGKWWETIFLPLSQTGSVGISVTTWGKKHATGGSCQAKVTTHTEWYDIVCTKISASKGYETLSYMGRPEGLTFKHRRSLAASVSSDRSIGAGGATIEQFADEVRDHGQVKAYSMIAAKIGLGLMQVAPALEFFKKMKENGHDLGVEIKGRLPILKTDESFDMAKAYLASICAVLDNESWQMSYQDKPKEPEIDRHTVYDSWGNFG